MKCTDRGERWARMMLFLLDYGPPAAIIIGLVLFGFLIVKLC